LDILNLGTGYKLVKAGEGDRVVNHDLHKHAPYITVAHDLNIFPWPWEDSSFDLIVACAVMEHLRVDLLESVNECWRLLRPEGVLYLKLPYWHHDNSYVDVTHYWRFSLKSCDVFDPTTSFGTKYRFYTDRKWRILQRPKLNKSGSSFSLKMRVLK
jgi:predicted SAM-dependent methyltransferase